LVAIAADGSRVPRVLLNPDERHVPMAITPDGRTLVVRRDTGTGAALSSAYLTVALSSDFSEAGPPEPLFESRVAMGQLSLSPDGKWAAYESTESGREEIYAVPFPTANGKWQISTGGGSQPRWNRTGRELVYRNRDEILAVRVDTNPTFRSGTPTILASGLRQRQFRPAYDVDRSGHRFLMLKLAETPPSDLHVVVNWFEELRRRAPADRARR
jgi:hypothetical protein